MGAGELIGAAIRITRSTRYRWHEHRYKQLSDPRTLHELKHVCFGNPLLVVGNGYSLNDTPLDAFADVASIGMNKIDLIYPRVGWRPTLVVAENSVVVAQHWRRMVSAGVPVYLSWKNRWLISRSARPKFRFYLTYTSDTFSKDITEGVGSSDTVTYTALQFAFYMGANPVVLVGVDHSFDHETRRGKYVRRTGPDSNHFDPDYFPDGSYWGLPNLVSNEHSYRLAKTAFSGDGRDILDATVGGKLRVFPRVSVDEALRIFGRNR